MATTTAVATYRSAGQPDDAVGAVGDVCFDTLNRIEWVKQSNNSWVGGAYNQIGPTGPAQLSYKGVPPDTFGQNGNGCCDTTNGNLYLKANNTWSLTGANPQGPQGPSTLGSAGLAIGPVPSASSLSLSSTPVVIPMANSAGIQSIYQPPSASAYLGGTFGNLGTTAVVFELYNQTTSTSILTHSVAAQTITSFGQFSATAYPLVVGNNYVWRITSATSTTSAVYCLPTYLTPSNSPSASVTFTGTSGFSANTTFTSTQQIAPVMGNTTACPWEIRPFRAAYVYQVIATFTPSGSTASSATLSLAFYAQGPNTTQKTLTVSANGLPQLLGTFQPNELPMTANGTQYYWKVSGANVTGYLQIETLCVL